MEIFEMLKTNYQGFQEVFQLIVDSINAYRDKVKLQQTKANTAIQFIRENIDQKVGKIASHIKTIESDVEFSNHQEAFKLEFIKRVLTLSERFNMPIKIANGLMVTKEVGFRKRSRQWVEAEILPLFYEVWEIMEFITDNLKMALMNIQNRATIISNELKNGNTPLSIEDTDAPLNTFLSRTDKWTNDLHDLFNLITQRLEGNFILSNIYDEKEEFLPIPLQSTLNQSWLTGNQLFQSISKLYRQASSKVQQFRNTVEQESSLSTSEKIVRYVQTHGMDESAHHYNSIFLTKGYIGEAFWVEREQEMRHIQNLIEHWKLGFRGSVLLHGQRFSGKTLFGEMIANRYFQSNVVRLSPNNMVYFNGRKFYTSYDLGEALEFVQKHNQDLKPLIWIDDIELWSSPENLITQNIRQLKRFIDNHSNSMFFVVSMSNWMKKHLDGVFEVSKVFQANFNLDKMEVAEMQKAILIRHGATHCKLVDEYENEVTKNQIRKFTYVVSKSTNGNIGEALNLWSISMREGKEENVKFKLRPNYAMPDFINPDVGIILATIMMEKRTNEYRLSKLFGKAFKEKYINIIQRLISVGLLSRHLDGWLEINEVVVNEVGRALEQDGYLKFND
ncbi:MAG: ATP-binding protein [Saprospiraceae bacterium]|nr:ATP-binding protein [Saprospiraceae bacterium]